MAPPQRNGSESEVWPDGATRTACEAAYQGYFSLLGLRLSLLLDKWHSQVTRR